MASHRAITKVVAAVEQEGAKVVGIAELFAGSGASLIARSIAGAYDRFGKKALLVEANALDISSENAEPKIDASLDFTSAIQTVSDRFFTANLAEMEGAGVLARRHFREAFDRLQATDLEVVVDLPSVYTQSGELNMALPAIGAACEVVFLVCETAHVNRLQMADAIEFFHSSNINLAGLVMNDQRLFFNQFLTDS